MPSVFIYQDHNEEARSRSADIQEFQSRLVEPLVYKVDVKLWFEQYALWDNNQMVGDKKFLTELQLSEDMRKKLVVNPSHVFARMSYSATSDPEAYYQWKLAYRRLGHSPDFKVPEKMDPPK